MWYRMMMGAAVGSCIWLLLERIEADRPIARLYRVGDADAAIRRVGAILADEYRRRGVDARCQAAGGVMAVVASRRSHDRIVDALHPGRAGRAWAALAASDQPA